MILINEWLPNPVGNDTAGEFVELYNSGSFSVNLAGWTLINKGKKKVRVSGTIPARGYLALSRKQTKLVLKNADEGIALYDAAGKLMDESSFVGTAPDGKSFNRMEQLLTSQVGTPVQNFAWGKPTPGAPNDVMKVAMTQTAELPINIPINHSTASASGFFATSFGVAVLLTSLVLYSIKTHDNLSDIFFSRDEAVR
jgi:hypothetical protein